MDLAVRVDKSSEAWLNMTCPICGERFHMKPSRIEKAKHHYCSNTCHRIAKSEHFKGVLNPRYGTAGEIRQFTPNKLELNEIVEEYHSGCSLRSIAIHHGTYHRRIKELLQSVGVEIRKRGSCDKALRPLLPRVCNRKYKTDEDRRYNNIITHIRFDIDIEWISQFKDIDKIVFLNKQISDRGNRFVESTDWYKSYIEKFYSDEGFNSLYENYKKNNNYRYLKPSLDHKIPKSLGGTNDIDNLRFVTYLENMCKRDIPYDEWKEIKKSISEYLTEEEGD